MLWFTTTQIIPKGYGLYNQWDEKKGKKKLKNTDNHYTLGFVP